MAVTQIMLNELVLTNTVKAAKEEEGFLKTYIAVHADFGHIKQLTVSKWISHPKGQN